jgi:hypothetical protein
MGIFSHDYTCRLTQGREELVILCTVLASGNFEHFFFYKNTTKNMILLYSFTGRPVTNTLKTTKNSDIKCIIGHIKTKGVFNNLNYPLSCGTLSKSCGFVVTVTEWKPINIYLQIHRHTSVLYSYFGSIQKETPNKHQSETLYICHMLTVLFIHLINLRMYNLES